MGARIWFVKFMLGSSDCILILGPRIWFIKFMLGSPGCILILGPRHGIRIETIKVRVV